MTRVKWKGDSSEVLERRMDCKEVWCEDGWCNDASSTKRRVPWGSTPRFATTQQNCFFYL